MSVSFSRPGDAEGRESNNVVTVPQENISYALKEGEEFAGFFVRLFAYLIDLVYFSLLTFFLFLTFSFHAVQNLFIFDVVGNRILFLLVFIFLPLFFYFSVLLHLISTTPGKHFFGIKVVNSEGQKPSMWISYKKVIFDTVSFFIFGYLNILENENKQSWSDKKLQLFTIYKAKKKELSTNEEQIISDYVLKEGEEFASFWLRLVVFSSGILMAVTTLYISVWTLPLFFNLSFNDLPYFISGLSNFDTFLLQFLFVIVFFLVSFLFLRISKIFFGVRVIKGDGSRINIKTYYKKWLYDFFYFFGFLKIFKNEKRQSLSDIKLGIFVVHDLKKSKIIGFILFVVVTSSLLLFFKYGLHHINVTRMNHSGYYSVTAPLVAWEQRFYSNFATTTFNYTNGSTTEIVEFSVNTFDTFISTDSKIGYFIYMQEIRQKNKNILDEITEEEELISLSDQWLKRENVTQTVRPSFSMYQGNEKYKALDFSYVNVDGRVFKFKSILFNKNLIIHIGVGCLPEDCDERKHADFINSFKLHIAPKK